MQELAKVVSLVDEAKLAMHHARVALVFFAQGALGGHFTRGSHIKTQMQAKGVLQTTNKTMTGIGLTIIHDASALKSFVLYG